MKIQVVPFPSGVYSLCILLIVSALWIGSSSAAASDRSRIGLRSSRIQSNPSPTTSSNPFTATTTKPILKLHPVPSTIATPARVKRGHGHGHGRSYSTGIAYSRLGDSGPRRGALDRGHGEGHGNRRSPIGEDGTNTRDFKSHGVGYEHQHGGHCEESKCGYNIRHCPHGCVFNSLSCGGGAAYDTCCC